MRRIATSLLFIVTILISSCDRQISPPTVVVPLPPKVIISTATVPPTDTTIPPTDTPIPSPTFIPTDTELPSDTPVPTDTALPTHTATAPATEAPFATEAILIPTQPPPPTAAPQVASVIIPDVQGCAARPDIDSQLYGHAYVESPVANDNGQMRVKFFLNSAPIVQDFPVQQVLTLGPFKDGDIVGDGNDSWSCTKPTQVPGGPGCYCIMVPSPTGYNSILRFIVHIRICYDSSGNVVSGCPLLAYCGRKPWHE